MRFVLLTRHLPLPENVELSPAEREVLRLLQRGERTAHIAAMRNVSHSTIAKQLASIYRKMHVHSRAELLASLAG